MEGGLQLWVDVTDLENMKSYRAEFDIERDDLQPVREVGGWEEKMGLNSRRGKEINEYILKLANNMEGKFSVEMELVLNL